MNIVQFTLVFLFRAYQTLLSPVLAAVLGPSARCRFTPTCSQYAIEAVRLRGAVMGGWLALRRLGRCHPWGGCGEDPVPAALLRDGRPMARLISEQIKGRSLRERPRPIKNSGRARLQPSLPDLTNYHGS